MIKRNLKIDSSNFELCTEIINYYLGKNIKFYQKKKMCSSYMQMIKSND